MTRAVSHDKDHRKYEIKVNQINYRVKLHDEKDMLIEMAGITKITGKMVDELRTPMPGLILDIRLLKGLQVKIGESLVILKAMKMENILKSPQVGAIRKIVVEKNQKIEKDSVLIQF